MRISKDRVNMDDKVLQKAVLKDYGEAVVTANSGSEYTIDLTQGNVFNIILTDNCAFTFANPSPNGTACSFTLILTQDATGSRTVTWPSAVRWPNGTEPTLYAGPDSLNIFTFLTISEGAAWFGASADGVEVVSYPIYLAYGYFGGGFVSPSTRSTVDRIDYSNDTATATVRGPLSLARDTIAAAGHSTHGYFGGGYAPGFRSTVDRIDYANDTATASVQGPLSTARAGLAGAQNSPL